MPSGIVVLIAALVICAPATVHAQVPTLPDDTPGVSSQPPVPLDGDPSPEPEPQVATDPQVATTDGTAVDERPDAAAEDELPATGVDIVVLLLTGAMLTLLGVALRLRSADAEYH